MFIRFYILKKITFFQVEKLEHDSRQQHAELMHLRDERQSAIALALREKDDEVKKISIEYIFVFIYL
jgi:hypothetical protein